MNRHWRDFPRHWESSDALCSAVRERTDTSLLAFSCGKDSIACWLRMLEYGFKVIPYIYELIPGLEFVDEGIRYFEDHFKTEIVRLTSPSFVRMLKHYVYQPPDRTRALYLADLPSLTYEDCQDEMRHRYGGALPIAIGVRIADSLQRRTSVKAHGACNTNQGTWYPVFDWSTKYTYQRINDVGIRLPVDYEMFGRTFDGINEQFLRPIRDRYPRDYDRILEWFPLADLEFTRRALCPQIDAT